MVRTGSIELAKRSLDINKPQIIISIFQLKKRKTNWNFIFSIVAILQAQQIGEITDLDK